jgi:hypothetical protein
LVLIVKVGDSISGHLWSIDNAIVLKSGTTIAANLNGRTLRMKSRTSGYHGRER